jgi:hypothetical protein
MRVVVTLRSSLMHFPSRKHKKHRPTFAPVLLKSGCKAETARLRTAERLVKLIAVFCILSWRVFWMTMINRSAPNTPPALALPDLETALLDQLVPDKREDLDLQQDAFRYLIKVARLGGYLARASDPPPGNTVMWRGLSRPRRPMWTQGRRRDRQSTVAPACCSPSSVLLAEHTFWQRSGERAITPCPHRQECMARGRCDSLCLYVFIAVDSHHLLLAGPRVTRPGSSPRTARF